MKNHLRKIFYSMSPKWRFIIRRLYFLPQELLTNNREICPPKGLIYTGSGDFLKQDIEWKLFYIQNGLEQNHSFLDIGSGIGRIALGLKDFLKGDYHGFEAMQVGVDWCQKNITPKYPNFYFEYVPIYNDLYNNNGINASEYEFGYISNKFDFAVSISVFTHMIDKELENYLNQCNKVLKSKGILVATFFITNNGENATQEHLSSSFTFSFEYENYFLMDKNVKSANVCFKRKYLNNVINKNGFEIVKEIKGSWSGHPKHHFLAFQDILVLKKR